MNLGNLKEVSMTEDELTEEEIEAKLTWRTIQRDPTLMQECLVGTACGHPVRLTVLGPLEGSRYWCDRCIKYTTVTEMLVIRTIEMPEAAEKPMSEITTPPTNMRYDSDWIKRKGRPYGS